MKVLKVAFLSFLLLMFPVFVFATANHTITTDQDFGDWASDELIQTDDTTGAKLYVTWDSTNLYVAVEGFDISTNSGNNYTVHIAIHKQTNAGIGRSDVAWGTDGGDNIFQWFLGSSDGSENWNPQRDFLLDPKSINDVPWLNMQVGYASGNWADYGWFNATGDYKLTQNGFEFAIPWKKVDSAYPGPWFHLVVVIYNRAGSVDLTFPKENPKGTPAGGGKLAMRYCFAFASTNDGDAPNSCTVVENPVPTSVENSIYELFY